MRASLQILSGNILDSIILLDCVYICPEFGHAIVPRGAFLARPQQSTSLASAHLRARSQRYVVLCYIMKCLHELIP